MRRSAPARHLNLAQQLFDELSADADSLVMRARALPLPPSGRAWVRVTDSRDADAWLIAWTPGSATGCHDHGASRGVVGVLHGTLTERYWSDHDGAVLRRAIHGGAPLVVPPGRRHDVSNAGSDVVVSLHVYTPRLVQMNFYPERATVAV